MIRCIQIGFLLLFFAACAGENVATEIEKPVNLLPKEEFVSLLADVSIIEATHQMRYIQVSRYSSILQEECDSLFMVKNTNREAFEATMTYYSMQSELMKSIYEEVSKEVEKRKSELLLDSE